MHTGQLFIAGGWRAPASGSTYDTINPATEEPSAQVGRGDERDVEARSRRRARRSTRARGRA